MGIEEKEAQMGVVSGHILIQVTIIFFTFAPYWVWHFAMHRGQMYIQNKTMGDFMFQE
jgi:hypothetical protein